MPLPLPEGPMVIGLDLGAGTGLACAPIKHAVARAAQRAHTHAQHSHHPRAAAGAGAGAGADADVDQAAWEEWAAVAVGIVGVDLSPKMLAKVRALLPSFLSSPRSRVLSPTCYWLLITANTRIHPLAYS